MLAARHCHCWSHLSFQVSFYAFILPVIGHICVACLHFSWSVVVSSRRTSEQRVSVPSSIRLGRHAPVCAHMHVIAATVNSLCNDCFSDQETCPYIELSLPRGTTESECKDWSPMALSLHQDCPYIKCHYKESLLYDVNGITDIMIAMYRMLGAVCYIALHLCLLIACPFRPSAGLTGQTPPALALHCLHPKQDGQLHPTLLQVLVCECDWHVRLPPFWCVKRSNYVLSGENSCS